MAKLGKKLLIIGSGGSGKSTLARHLGEILALPVIHLDQAFWHVGWIKTPKEEWHRTVRHFVMKPEWIIEGNYSGTLETRLNQADTVIFLDFNRLICIGRVIRRWLAYLGKTRPDMPEGCVEKIDFSFLKWLWQFPSNVRPNIIEKSLAYNNLEWIIVKNPRMLKQFVREISKR